MSSHRFHKALASFAGALVLGGLAAAQSTAWSIDDPAPNATYATILSDAAVRLTGIADDFQLVGPGVLVEANDSSARVSGVIARKSNPNRRFRLELDLAGYMRPGTSGYAWMSPYKKLKSTAYSNNGGPVNSSTWRYFRWAWGTLEGEGDYAGARIGLTQPCGEDLQIGKGANNRNVEEGAYGRFVFKTLSQPNNHGLCLPWCFQCGDLSVQMGGDEEMCAKEIKSNVTVAYGHFLHAFYLPGIGTDFVFSQPGRFVERADGTASLTGRVARVSNPLEGFDVQFDWTGRIDPGDVGYPPFDSPKLELQPKAYIDHGGAIDPATWHYYQTTTGVLTGRNNFSGAVLAIQRMGPCFQVGKGANGMNLKLGASGWLDIQIASQPSFGPALALTDIGDINLELDVDCEMCADKADRDTSYGQFAGGHAFYLPGIGTDFVWQTPGVFTERSDGTATLTGTLMRASNTNWRFVVDLTFTQRVNADGSGFPPSGSPKLELLPAAYVSKGGPINPATWHYYLGTAGTLTGQGSLAGAVIKLTRYGPAFQVGLGANGKNLLYGASGWLNLQTLKNAPGKCFPCNAKGDINIDIEKCE